MSRTNAALRRFRRLAGLLREDAWSSPIPEVVLKALALTDPIDRPEQFWLVAVSAQKALDEMERELPASFKKEVQILREYLAAYFEVTKLSPKAFRARRRIEDTVRTHSVSFGKGGGA